MAATHSLRHQVFVEGCYLCRLRSVSVAPSAMPTRTGADLTISRNNLTKSWDQDIPAYKRLVKAGHQPESVDGAANIERKVDARMSRAD